MKLFHNGVAWRWAERVGFGVFMFSLGVLIYIFYPVLVEEVSYQLRPRVADVAVVSQRDREQRQVRDVEGRPTIIVPVDEDFGIIIPKIGANARVIPDVDWRDAMVYRRALAEGVAQAVGTARPGTWGNVFLFAHSGVDMFEAERYNALFYLTDKLVTGDEIVLFYRGEKFLYRVTEKMTVAPESIEYVEGDRSRKTLTLMTCWPAGTTFKRLLIIAEQVDPLSQ